MGWWRCAMHSIRRGSRFIWTCQKYGFISAAWGGEQRLQAAHPAPRQILLLYHCLAYATSERSPLLKPFCLPFAGDVSLEPEVTRVLLPLQRLSRGRQHSAKRLPTCAIFVGVC